MSIDKLKTKFFTGAWLTDVKHYFTKINEIIDWINNVGSTTIPTYKVYIGLITQTGTDAPTVNILENTLGNIVWGRTLAGQYTGNLSGAFTTNKTFFRIANNTDGSFYVTSLLATTNVIGILCSNDNIMQDIPIEIRVYN